MAAMGHEHRIEPEPPASGVPQRAEIRSVYRDFSTGPLSDSCSATCAEREILQPASIRNVVVAIAATPQPHAGRPRNQTETCARPMLNLGNRSPESAAMCAPDHIGSIAILLWNLSELPPRRTKGIAMITVPMTRKTTFGLHRGRSNRP
jgi:hypothetical protein